MSRSEEAYHRFTKGGEKKSRIASEMNVTRKTVRTWIAKELEKRERAYNLLIALKEI